MLLVVYNKVSQLHVYLYIFPFPFGATSPRSTQLGHHRALSLAPCATQQVSTSYFTQGSLSMSVPIFQFIPHTPPRPLSTLISDHA